MRLAWACQRTGWSSAWRVRSWQSRPAVQIRAAAVTDDGTAGAAWVGTVMARRPSAGAVVVGTAVWLLSDADGAGWEVRVVSDGADGFEVQVRGDPSPATELRWRVTATITEAS